MKNAIKLIGIMVMFLVSCKNESPKHSTTDTTNPMNEELTNTTNYEESGNFSEAEYSFDKETDSLNENWNLDDPNRQKQLYARFDMTANQIQEYEKALNDWWAADKKDEYQTLSANERIKKERDILKGILDESQFRRYEDWADENDDR